MAESRFGNYESCCRLCLCDKVDSLQSVFDDATAESSLVQRISDCVAIEITTTDKISTMVCWQCISKISSFQIYKEQCSENQTKLEQWMHSWTAEIEMADMSIQIKEEPVGDEEDVDVEAVEPGQVSLKMEPIDEVYDFPPPLTPHPLDFQLEEIEINVIGDSQSSLNPALSSSGSSKRCSICDKTFSSSGNKRRHEKDIHGKETLSIDQLSDDELSQNSMDSQSGNKKPVEAAVVDSEQQKIQFAAGLKLLQANETPIAFESLSKVELSYLEKCKAMVNMYKTFECACHQVAHPNFQGLLSHLKGLRIWFPVFTCYNCMITFTNRSNFKEHNMLCQRPATETLVKISNLRKRSEVKTRLYQNFRCTKCKFIFTFHEEYWKHVNEEHISGEAPYKCGCSKNFEMLQEYKDHIYLSCLVEFYCDICFVTVSTLEDFQKHAVEVHDHSEGFALLQDDNYTKRKFFTKTTPRPAVRMSLKRRCSSYNKNPPILEPELEEVKPAHSKVPNPVCNSKKVPTKCPVCSKVYSTFHSMMRHHNTHTNSTTLAVTKNKENSPNLKSTALYSCPDCGGMYNDEEWQIHLTKSHNNKSTCDECGKVFQFQTELDQHKTVHLNLKVYKDSKTKSYKSILLKLNGKGDVLLTCETCDKIFSSKDELKTHKLHHENMPLLSPAGEENLVKDDKFYCKPCKETFSGYATLWKHNKNNHPLVKTPESKDFPKQCKYCDKLFYTGGSHYMHKQMHERINQTCNKVVETGNEAMSTRQKKNDSLAANKEGDESYHTCKSCFKVFSSRSSLKNHIKSHGGASINSKSNAKNSKGKKVWCEICHTSYTNPASLGKHKKEEHNNDEMPTLTSQVKLENKGFVFTCDVCVSTFTTKLAFKKHKEKHVKELKVKANKVYCKYCKIPFDSVGTLNKHMVIEHEEAKPKVVKGAMEKIDNNLFCNICKKSFITFAGLRSHQRSHIRKNRKAKVNKFLKPKATGAKPAVVVKPEFQCSTCLAELPNDTALQIHVLEKHRNVNAAQLVPRCNFCNLDFKKVEDYETHKRFHDFLERQKSTKVSPVKPPGNSPVHQQPTHPKGKSFPCKYCSAEYNRADRLRSHMRQKHKEMLAVEHKCTQCERVFDKQTSLSIHLKVHKKQRSTTEPKPTAGSKPLFSCSICNMGFNLPKDLRVHTIKAHPF